MKLSIPCKSGKIQLTDDDILQIVQPFGRILWQVPRSDVTGFTTQPSALVMLDVTIHSNAGTYTAEVVTKQNFEKLRSLFSNTQTQATGKEWYHSPTALTHVATYTREKDMQREVEIAGQFGWVPQTSAGVSGHVRLGRTLTKAVLTGGIGLMATGASRSKDKITITYVRSPEWLAQHK